jgi:hypothetical protein
VTGTFLPYLQKPKWRHVKLNTAIKLAMPSSETQMYVIYICTSGYSCDAIS